MENIKPRVLIVDDEKGLRLGAKRLLEREGFEVTTAENGGEGISFGTSTEFDLAIIDLKMPDINGMQVLKEIKTKFPHTICFIATAYASYDSAIEAAKIGAFSYIPKPFSPEELLQHINKGYESRLLLIEADKLRKEREERLLEVAFEKTRINTIVNSIADGILVVNKNGEAVLYNPSALKLLDLDEIKIEEYIIDKIHPDIAVLINKILIKDKFENKSFSSQVKINSSPFNGTADAIFLEATSSPVPHPDGSLAGVVVVFKNITELKKLEFLKSQFVSMVSHELKAPVAAVYGYLKILSDKNMHVTPEQQHNFIERSQIRLDGLLKIVNDLLDISRMEMNTVQREMKEINVLEIIRSVIELFQLDVTNKSITVNINDNSKVFCISADQIEITRLFTNLISNAIKYNKKSGSINISINNSDHYLTIEISDTGIGMKPAELKNLFQEFYRAKNEFTKKISGTGLGLSIVKRIIDSYSGKIEVKSIYNEGTTFKVFLPAGKLMPENKSKVNEVTKIA